jgi:hypothetical protein
MPGSDIWAGGGENQILRTAGSDSFEKLQRTIGFHERTNKDPTVLGGY